MSRDSVISESAWFGSPRLRRNKVMRSVAVFREADAGDSDTCGDRIGCGDDDPVEQRQRHVSRNRARQTLCLLTVVRAAALPFRDRSPAG